MDADTRTAAVLHKSEVVELGSLSVALFGDGYELLALGNHRNAGYVVIAAKCDSANASSRSAHASYVLLGESYRITLAGRNNKLALTLSALYEDKLVALVKVDRDLTALAVIYVLCHRRSLDNAHLCDHCEVILIRELGNADDGSDLLSLCQLDEVYDISSLCGSRCLGDLICLAEMYLTRIGKEHKVGVAVNRKHLLDEVLLLGGHTDNALAASVLYRIGVGGETLDVAATRQGDNTLVTLDKILKNDVVLCLNDLGAAGVGILILDLGHLVLDDLLDAVYVGKYSAKVDNKRVKSCKLFLDLVSLHARQLSEGHLNDRLSLNIGETEALHQGSLGLGYRLGGLHYLNDLVDIVKSDLVALVDVRSRKSLVKLKLCAAGYNALLMLDITVEDLGKGESLGLAVEKSKHIYSAGVLKLCVFIKLIEDYLSVCVTAMLDDDTHTRSARFVAHIGDALDLLFLNEVSNALAKKALVNAVGDLGNDDAVLILLHRSAGSDHNSASARGISLDYAVLAVDYRVCGEIGTLDELHKLGNGALGILHSVYSRVDDLTQVVGRDIGRHTDGDTHRAVYKKIGKS